MYTTFRLTLLVNHVLISIYEQGSKVSKNFTTETVTTETFGGVSVVFWVLSYRIY